MSDKVRSGNDRRDSGTRSLPYETWAVLPERDILLLKALGVVMLPERQARTPKEKVEPLPEYHLTVDFKCKLCNSEYQRFFHMQGQKDGSLRSAEVEHIPTCVASKKQRVETVPTCKCCEEVLALRDNADLVSKCMKLASRLG